MGERRVHRSEDVLLELLPTDIGPIVLATNVEGQLLSLEFARKEKQLRRYVKAIGYRIAGEPLVSPVSENSMLIAAYLAGDVLALDRVDVVLTGSPFRRQVAALMRKIPVGQTRSYGALARELGGLQRARAVARVAATNPLTLVVPCHRLLGSDGQLTGYGSGLHRKRWLLDHEARFAGQTFELSTKD